MIAVATPAAKAAGVLLPLPPPASAFVGCRPAATTTTTVATVGAVSTSAAIAAIAIIGHMVGRQGRGVGAWGYLWNRVGAEEGVEAGPPLRGTSGEMGGGSSGDTAGAGSSGEARGSSARVRRQQPRERLSG
jgi:hypothetical protein